MPRGAVPPSAADIISVPTDWGALDVTASLGPLLDEFLQPEETFVTLAKRRGVHLSVHAYDMTAGAVADFGIHDTPDMSVRAAVCASCCVPLLFRPVAINGSLFVDGAVAQRTPIHMLSRTGADARATLVLDVVEEVTSGPTDFWDYIQRLTSASGRLSGDTPPCTFVRIEIPMGAPTLLDLPPFGLPTWRALQVGGESRTEPSEHTRG